MSVEFPERAMDLFKPAPFKVMHGGRGSSKSWNFARALLILGSHPKLYRLRQWRLTWWGCDVTGELPSKKFILGSRKSEKQNAVSKYPVAVSNQSQRAA